MAVVRFNSPFSQNTLEPFGGEITATANTIVVDDGLNRAVYTGDFSADSTGYLSGTFRGIEVILGGQPAFTATNLNYPAGLLASYIDNGDIQGAFQAVLNGADTLYGSAGADGIQTYDGADRIEAGDGADIISAGFGDDTIFAGVGADYVIADAGNDLVFGGQGAYDDQIFAGFGNDTVYAGDGNDQVYGEFDADFVGGGQGADYLSGGDGNDTIFGGGGIYSDRIEGGTGSDHIFAGAGNNIAFGGDGNDEVGAGAGADTVRGGVGNDIIYLGARDGAADLYISDANNGSDTVYGFENGIDHLDLSASGFTNFAQVQAVLGLAPDGDATITLASGQILTLDGVTAAQLDASDFLLG